MHKKIELNSKTLFKWPMKLVNFIFKNLNATFYPQLIKCYSNFKILWNFEFFTNRISSISNYSISMGIFIVKK
jgi:hypothetical protein